MLKMTQLIYARALDIWPPRKFLICFEFQGPLATEELARANKWRMLSVPPVSGEDNRPPSEGGEAGVGVSRRRSISRLSQELRGGGEPGAYRSFLNENAALPTGRAGISRQIRDVSAEYTEGKMCRVGPMRPLLSGRRCSAMCSLEGKAPLTF